MFKEVNLRIKSTGKLWKAFISFKLLAQIWFKLTDINKKVSWLISERFILLIEMTFSIFFIWITELIYQSLLLDGWCEDKIHGAQKIEWSPDLISNPEGNLVAHWPLHLVIQRHRDVKNETFPVLWLNTNEANDIMVSRANTIHHIMTHHKMKTNFLLDVVLQQNKMDFFFFLNENVKWEPANLQIKAPNCVTKK